MILWLALVALDWTIIVAVFVGAWQSHHLLGYWVASLVIGNRQQALGVLGHEGAHGLICRDRRQNNGLAAVLCFWPFGASFAAYRAFHLAHHRALGTPHDPELPLRDKLIFRPLTRMMIARSLARYLLGLDTRKFIAFLWIIRPGTVRGAIGPCSTVVIFWSACLWFDAGWVVGLWYFSLFTSFRAFLRMRELTEHMETRWTHRLVLPVWQKVLWAPHWISYHHEHHAHPNVRCWRLPNLRRALTSPRVVPMAEFYDWLAQRET